ncbi:MAG TPA: hypothetical protein VGO40_18765 [Longimicrobium sp.]|jgi:hypothetical protein|nr:hypothetical protein [Longimicrobium sp.]
MNERWSDLSPLDPERDPHRWEALLRGTRAAAAGELARRAFAAGPAGQLARWVLPALAMAASLVIAAAGMLSLAEGTPQAQATPGVAEAMGVPYAMTVSAEEGARDAADQLLLPDATESR